MARDLNARRDAARQQKEKERTERHEKLETDVTGLFEDILDSTFPQKDDDTPDWDKFNWTRAEALKQLLDDFQNNRTRTEPATPRRERQADRTAIVTPPSGEPTAVAPDLDLPVPPKRRVRDRVKEGAKSVWTSS